MYYLIPPNPDVTCASVAGYDQVDIGPDGLFRVESEYHANALINQCGFRRATNELIASTASEKTIGKPASEEDGDEFDWELPIEDWKKPQLKQWLIDNKVDFDKKAKIDELFELVKENSEEED